MAYSRPTVDNPEQDNPTGFDYAAAGNLEVKTDPRGGAASTTYDAILMGG